MISSRPLGWILILRHADGRPDRSEYLLFLIVFTSRLCCQSTPGKLLWWHTRNGWNNRWPWIGFRWGQKFRGLLSLVQTHRSVVQWRAYICSPERNILSSSSFARNSVLSEDVASSGELSEMGKMQVLGVVAVLLAVYCVHAKIYFREEFQDGGKFGVLMYNASMRSTSIHCMLARVLAVILSHGPPWVSLEGILFLKYVLVRSLIQCRMRHISVF